MKKNLLLLLLLVVTAVFCNSDSILMRDIHVLTLKDREWTSFRRTKALPQLNCIGGDAMHKRDLFPQIVQCKNQGTDDRGNVQWKCEADLDERVRLGKVTVSCEGYSRPGDAYVLKGSCGLEYELWLTDAGKKAESKQGSRRGGFRSSQKQRQQQREQRSYQQSYQDTTYTTSQPYADSGSWIGLIVIIGIVLTLVYCFSGANAQQPTVIRATTSNPPPTTSNMYPNVPPYNPEFVPTYDTPSYTTNQGPSWTTTATTTAAGFGAGYLLGRNTAPQQPTEVHHHYHNDAPSNNYTVYPEPTRYESSDSDKDDDKYTTRKNTSYGDTNVR